MAKAFNEEERERINVRLIQAGKKMLNKAGIRSVVIDDIVREAGISKGSFYSFYHSREDFILSVLECWEGEYRKKLFKDVLEFSGSAKEVLEQFFLGLLEMLEKEPGLALLSFSEIDRIIARLPQERINQHQEKDMREMHVFFSIWIERGILNAEDLDDFQGIPMALFTLAMHREEFPEGTYTATINRVVSALAESFGSRKRIKGELM